MRVSNEKLEGFLEGQTPSWDEVQSMVAELHRHRVFQSKLKTEYRISDSAWRGDPLAIYGEFDELLERMKRFEAPFGRKLQKRFITDWYNIH